MMTRSAVAEVKKAFTARISGVEGQAFDRWLSTNAILGSLFLAVLVAMAILGAGMPSIVGTEYGAVARRPPKPDPVSRQPVTRDLQAVGRPL